MRVLVLTLVSIFMFGIVAGTMFSGFGSDRRELLLDVNAAAGISTWFALAGGLLLLALQVFVAVLNARALSFQLRLTNLLWLYLGVAALGVVLGSLLIYMWMWDVEVGRSNTEYASEPGIPWNGAQWAAYLAPPILQILLGIGAIIAIIVGIRALRPTRGFLRMASALPQQGIGLTGRIVHVGAAPDDAQSTRIIAEAAAPDGQRLAESIVRGTDREWLQREPKVVIWVDRSAPYDPSRAALRVTKYWKGGTFPVSTLPPAGTTFVRAPGTQPTGR